jgi:cellulose synthase/poly-beta-1,6-N-acetylglucosamine synthase-like glycosyltransferase
MDSIFWPNSRFNSQDKMQQCPCVSPIMNKRGPTVSIIICTKNRVPELTRCLRAVSSLTVQPEEVIVVDNTAGNSSTESVARDFAARYFVEPTQGLSRARNRGLNESRCEVVAYLDDDAIPEGQWLGRLIEPFTKSSVAVVTGETVAPLSTISGVERESIRILDQTNPHWFEIASYGGLGIGTNMAFRRSACRGWKLFDERLGRGALLHSMEEHHAFTKLLSMNYSAVHVPAALVFHESEHAGDIRLEARNRVAYWLFLFSEFPSKRWELIRFLFQRLRKQPLGWERNSPDPGGIVTSGWKVLTQAGLAGVSLFLLSRLKKK